ncbi:MAG: glycoside hydrolase family 13 protein [Clostridiales bacterium]|nr:glycoside hydrolase family 13 protein [Clostridiales bacterium]
MKNNMNSKYYFTDETILFRQPVQPEIGDEIVLRFQAAKDDAVSVVLVWNGCRMVMNVSEERDCFRFFEARVRAGKEKASYYFEISEAGKTKGLMYYDRRGLVEKTEPGFSFCVFPGFVVPEWIQGAVMYQIFVDRFCNGDPSNDVLEGEYLYLNHQPVKRITDWNQPLELLDVGRFYGGDLQGVWKKLDYLQELGVEVIYMNPIFVSPSNHKYDSQDYDHVDPHLAPLVLDGGEVLDENGVSNDEATKYKIRVTSPENLKSANEYFIALVEEIHRRGMKIILDGVFNHCGSFHKWMDREGLYTEYAANDHEKGAWQSKRSRYREYFRFTGAEEYESWWDNLTLPKLNYEGSQRLQNEILRIAAKWVSPPYCVDGWRLDVAADLGHSEAFNHTFWKKFRDVVKKANPKAVILAEHYGDVSPWLQGREWDTVMNYDAFMEPVSWFLTGMDKHSDHYRADLEGNAEYFWDTMKKNRGAFSWGSYLGAMNQLDNHDHSRFLTRTNKTCGRLASKGAEAASKGINWGIYRQGIVMQMTWPGAPTLYYGDETGICGWTDPDSRRTYPWGKEDWLLIDFYKNMIRIHRKISACRTGSLHGLLFSNHLIAYGRRDNQNWLVTVINKDTREREAELDLTSMGILGKETLCRVMETTEKSYNVGKVFCSAENGKVKLLLPPVSSRVYVCQKAAELL